MTLSRKDVQAAKRLFRLFIDANSDQSDYLTLNTPPESIAGVDRTVLIERARRDFHNRRRRAGVFGAAMFGEPAWDMMLALYILDMSGARQTMRGVTQISEAPATTAKRWLDYLIVQRLVRRDEHPTDRRTSFVSLTEKGRQKMDLYYSGTAETEV